MNGLQIILLIVGAIIFLIIGFRLEEAIRGYRAWQHYEAEAKQRGAKIAMTDFVPPPIPDAENFASIRIFEAAFRASEKGAAIAQSIPILDSNSARRNN